MMKFAMPCAAAVVAALLAHAPAEARTSGVGRAVASTHSSHSSHSTRSTTPKTTKALPVGTHFVRKTCKTASCKAKHPSGSYMLPIKPKKTG